MGLPARKLDTPSSAPELRLINGGRVPSTDRHQRCHSASVQAARHRRMFGFSLLLLILVLGVAMVRVQLSVEATEAALTAHALEVEIDRERIRGEMLEANRNELASPARIQNIASGAMGMGMAQDVSYLTIPAHRGTDDPADAPFAAAAAEPTANSRIDDILAEVMRMAVGEVQVLLVGHAGIASSR